MKISGKKILHLKNPAQKVFNHKKFPDKIF